MRKEVVWAIIAGIVLGLIVAYGVWRINSTMSANKKIAISQKTPNPTPSGPMEFKVVIDKPLTNDVVTTSSITVTGITKPSAWITLNGESDDYVVQADTLGGFSQDVSLTSGVNQIKVTAFDPNGNQNASDVLVIYSSSFQERSTASSLPSTDASGSSDIRKKVAEDVANTINRPKAYIGTVTDITDSTVEIKTGTSEIQQISINATTTNVVNAVGAANKQVKTTDIAIGDNIIAMGYVETNSVLGAQRILVTNPITESKITVSLGKITAVTKKSVTVSGLLDSKEEVLQPVTSTVIKTVTDGKVSSAKLSALAANDTLIYVTETDEKNIISVRSIFQIQKP